MFFLLSMVANGQVIPAIPGKTILPLAEVREGMRGTSRTVFRGTEPEEFNVEILGILPGAIGPKQDMIVCRIGGGPADRTFVFAGMSGSPVYVDGKLVGAIAFSFPFAKEGICGITPIEQMISTFSSAAKAQASLPVTFAASDLMSADWRRISLPISTPNIGGMVSGATANLASIEGQTFRPIATPLAFGGISQATFDVFAPDLRALGMVGVSFAGNAGKANIKKPDDTTLVGGSSVAVPLARGDISLVSAGTVTLRDGNKVYAFGHPNYGLGSTEMPMNESHVIVVVPNVNNSFKLAVPDAEVGSIVQDRATGIYGELGRPSKMMPVSVHIVTSRGRDETIKFDSVVDDLLTPIIVNLGTLNTIQGNERTIGETTIDVTGEITIANNTPVKIDRRYSGQAASAFAASAPSVPLAALLRSDLAGLDVTGVRLNLSVVEGSRNAALERISVDRGQLRAGETINVTLGLRTDTGEVVTQVIPVTVPADTPLGTLSLQIADGQTVQQASAVQQFKPRNAAELIALLNSLRRSDKLYAVLTRTVSGAVVGASEMPNLPPSMLATINSDRVAGGAKPVATKTILEQRISEGNYVVSGSQTIAIDVVR